MNARPRVKSWPRGPYRPIYTEKLPGVTALVATELLRLHVKRRSAKTRQPVLTSLYRSVYIVWKSFTSSRGVGEHLMCRLVNKGLYGVGKHAHWLQISRIWQLLFMPVMKLVLELWIVLHSVKDPSIADVHWRLQHALMSHVQVIVIKISHRFSEHNAEKHFGDYRLILHVSASA